MRTRSRLTLALALLTLAALPAAGPAQQSGAPSGQSPAAAAEPAIRMRTVAPRVVLAVSVRDKKGALLTNLQKSDLTLTEDGRPQSIQSLAPASQTPLRLGLILDTSRGMAGSTEVLRKATGKFVDQMLPAEAKEGAPAGQAFLLHFDRMVELLEDFTAERDKLHTELDGLGPTHGARDDRSGPETADDDRGGGRPGSRGGNGGSQLYDALFLAADELMKPAAGHHVLVVFSDGADHGSKESLNDAIDAADRAGVTVYTIYLKGERDREFDDMHDAGQNRRGGMGGGWPGSGGGNPGGGHPGGGGGSRTSNVDGKKILEKIAERTGGRAFEAKKKDALDEIFAQIATEIGGQLLVTYTPDLLDKEGSFHKVAVKANRDELTVSAPEGYYASAPGAK